MDHRFAFFGVKVKQDLRISLGAKGAPPCFERRPQLSIIVDLAIKRNHELAVVARHRLCTPFGKINNRQPSMPQAHTLILRIPLAEAIRSARGHMITNAPQLSAVDRVGGVMIRVDACDATHD